MCTVLLVEDEELERVYLKTLFTQQCQEYHVIGEACNGREAIALSKNLRPDVVFMDIKMPGIDGLTASKLIKKENPQTEIIILSAYDDFDYAQKALRLGASDYLVKPVQSEEIILALTRLGEKPVSRAIGIDADMKGKHFDSKYPFGKEKILVKALENKDAKLFSAGMKAFGDQLFQSSHEIPILQIHLLELVSVIARTLITAGFNREAIRESEFEIFKTIACLETLLEVKECLEILEKDLLEFIKHQTSDSKDLINQVLNYISANMSKSPSLREVAEHFHFSTGHLSRLIKKETGVTYPQYLNQIRLEAARMLLRKSDLDIGKIAYEVGYREVSHFNRVFKKTMGMNPTKYRQLSAY